MPGVADVTVMIDGRELLAQDSGLTGGLSVLVDPGSPGSRQLSPDWLRYAAGNGLRLIGYDRPGYGGSAARPGRVVADCAADVAAIASQLGLSRLAVWGVSGGGPFALACAALLPDLVIAACVFAPLGPYGEPGLDFLAGMSENMREEVRLFFEDRVRARENFRVDAAQQYERLAVPQGWLDRWGYRAETDTAHSREVAEHLALVWRDGMSHGDQGWWDDWAAFLSPWGFDLSSIRVPVQLWHGLADLSAPPAHGRWLAGQIQGVDAHFPEADDHTNVEALHRAQACEWLKHQA
jgi:pimeloyl-ACP methyl ester carboxylesterase